MKAASQWDFGGELFPVEATRRVLQVNELTTNIRRLLEKQIGQIWVTGEITNCRAQSSGHIYFTLKDSIAQVSCIVFRSDPIANREALQDGRHVILKGEMTLYEARGQYQLHVLAIEQQGVGALQEAFEKLKQKLAGEGLFAPERKRRLPRFPQRIGVATSVTGAAIRDVLHIVQRRNPTLQIILAPCAVQGAGAAGEIAAAIRLLNQWSAGRQKLDLILITRGGGSLEDLWAFNEEVVARAIVASALPVVSAVGHEIDFTISDFAADVRAATPSAAAEILTEHIFAAGKWMFQAQTQLNDAVHRRLQAERRHFQQLVQRLQSSHPRRKLNQRAQHLDDLQLTLSRAVRHDLHKLRALAENLRVRIGRARPSQYLVHRRAFVQQQERRFHEQARARLRQLRQRCEGVKARLQLLGPEQVLARGYSITLDAATGQIIRSAAQTRPGQDLKTKLQSGEIRSVVGG